MSQAGPDIEVERREDWRSTRPAMVEAAAGLVFIVIAAIGAWSLSGNIYLQYGRIGADPGAGFVPWITVYILGIGGALQIGWVLLRAWLAGGARWIGEFTIQRMWLPLLLIVSMVLYQVALAPLGFIVSSLLFAIPWAFIIHLRSGEALSPRYLLQVPAEACLLVAGIYAAFRYGIQIPFP